MKSTDSTTDSTSAKDSTRSIGAASGGSPDERPLLWSFVAPVGVVLAAGAFALGVPAWTSLRGVPGPTLLDAERPALAAAVAVVALVASAAVGIAVARVVNAVVGTFVVGCGLAMLAMRSGAVADFALGGSSPAAAAVESAVWAILVAAASWALYRFGGRLPDFPLTHEDEIDLPAGPAARRGWFGALAALPVAWMAAATDTKGQAIGAAILGGMAAGAVGRVLAPRTQPVYLAAATMAAFALAHVYLAFSAGSTDLAAAFVDGSLPRLFRIMPIDAAVGALVGTSMGFGAARGFATPRS